MCIKFRKKIALLLAGCMVFGSISLNGVSARASQDVSGGDVSAEVPDDGSAGTVGMTWTQPSDGSTDSDGGRRCSQAATS